VFSPVLIMVYDYVYVAFGGFWGRNLNNEHGDFASHVQKVHCASGRASSVQKPTYRINCFISTYV
jgi:hypothetical protein